MIASPRPRLFALLWVVAGLAIGPLTAVLTLFASFVLDLINPGLLIYSLETFSNGVAPQLALFALIGGFGVGILQQLIVKHCLRINLYGWWSVSALGGILAGALMWLLTGPLDYRRVLNALYDWGFKWTELEMVLLSLAFVLPLAGAQAIMLRQYGARGMDWIAAHACPFLPLALYAVLPVEFPEIVPELGFIFVFILPTMLLTAFTGIVMFRTVTRGRRMDKAKRKPHSRLFALLWFVVGNCVRLPVNGLGLLLFGGAQLALDTVISSDNNAYWAAMRAIGMVSAGVATGYCVGLFQQLIVSRTLKMDMRGWWRASVAGGLPGALLVLAYIDLTGRFHIGWVESDPSLRHLLIVTAPSVPFVIGPAIAQALWLRRNAVGARLWLLSHVVAVVLPPVVAVFAAFALDLDDLFRSGLWWQVYLCIVVIVTGCAMYRIALRSLRVDKVKRQPAKSAA